MTWIGSFGSVGSVRGLGLSGLWPVGSVSVGSVGSGLILRSLQEAAQERSGLSAGQRVLRQELPSG